MDGSVNQPFVANSINCMSGAKFHINKCITTASLVVVMLFMLISCQKEEAETIEAISDRSQLPRMHAINISTVISDSGITRYRINTPQWDVYDKAMNPYWEFPLGVHFERFDEQLRVNANIHCDYAKFLENQQIWELKGRVKATNMKGELFETEHLFWDQRMQNIHSDSMITITQATHIITGIGFDSNQEMTRYAIKNIQGVIPVEE